MGRHRSSLHFSQAVAARSSPTRGGIGEGIVESVQRRWRRWKGYFAATSRSPEEVGLRVEMCGIRVVTNASGRESFRWIVWWMRMAILGILMRRS
mmetsp:Transcript_11994/g.17218  ORF Transcript_11994/g.17218 Transcript_11994/m.17218 type:complete len:95 (-) Transcript_11994:218-502(-)